MEKKQMLLLILFDILNQNDIGVNMAEWLEHSLPDPEIQVLISLQSIV